MAHVKPQAATKFLSHAGENVSHKSRKPAQVKAFSFKYSVPLESMLSTADYMLNSKKNHQQHHIKWTWCCSFMTTMMRCALSTPHHSYREWTTSCQMCLGLQTWRLYCYPIFLDLGLLFHELYVSSANWRTEELQFLGHAMDIRVINEIHCCDKKSCCC